jgi:sulfite reductase alpha subunit-like flavoprotein
VGEAMKEPWKRRLRRLASWMCTAAMAGALCCIFDLAIQVHSYASPRIDLHHPHGHASSNHVLPASAASALKPPSAAANTDAPDDDHWGNGDVVSALTGFYQTVITILIALLGLVGVLSVITLRFLSNATAEETAHKAAQSAMEHAVTSKDFYDKLDEAVEQSEISKQLERLETDKSEILKQLEKLKARIQALEAGRQGPPDDERANGTITNPDA